MARWRCFLQVLAKGLASTSSPGIPLHHGLQLPGGPAFLVSAFAATVRHCSGKLSQRASTLALRAFELVARRTIHMQFLNLVSRIACFQCSTGFAGFAVGKYGPARCALKLRQALLMLADNAQNPADDFAERRLPVMPAPIHCRRPVHTS